MQQHLGEEFVGIISATAEFGLFVTLKDLYVDGMVHVSQLGDDFFVFDQSSQSLVGQNRGQIFGLGDEVKIKVAGVNLEERKIDFELIQQLTHAGRPIRARAPRVAENLHHVRKQKRKSSIIMSVRKKPSPVMMENSPYDAKRQIQAQFLQQKPAKNLQESLKQRLKIK